MLAVGLWMFGVAIAVSAMVITVAMELYSLQFALGTVTATFIAVAAMRDYAEAETHAAVAARRSAVLVRHMGILWGWAAVSVCIVYSTIMVWTQSWIPLFMVLVIACGICMLIANLLDRDAAAGVTDARVIAFIDRVVWAQFVAIVLLVGTLIAVGKFGAASFSAENKWAAMNIVLSTGFGLAIISGFSILNTITGGTPLAELATTKMADPESKAGVKAEPAATPRRRRPAARIV